MKVLDFNRSHTIVTSAQEGVEMNTCRSQVLASCTLTDDSQRPVTYYLCKECIGEHMYKEIGIAQVPTSEICTIFGEHESSLRKKFADHKDDVIQSGTNDVSRKGFAGGVAYWTNLRFLLKSAEARPLRTTDDIITATLGGESMVGVTTLADSKNGGETRLEYPIPYVNVHRPENRFQVDVGPILYPDVASNEPALVDRLQFAYVMYNQLEVAEFALRVPTVIGGDLSVETQHYSQVVKVPARSELFALFE
ncbi:uncharacterized protein METZ01_LOCUS233701 [marine metagenome]|uniref:Uncharacterized protein n=1 Tax=marine metagenome TaxID=408172 RepID=A0A382H1M9_9ZZZZ